MPAPINNPSAACPQRGIQTRPGGRLALNSRRLDWLGQNLHSILTRVLTWCVARQDVEREIRDREYVERIFEKVKEEYAKARQRCSLPPPSLQSHCRLASHRFFRLFRKASRRQILPALNRLRCTCLQMREVRDRVYTAEARCDPDQGRVPQVHERHGGEEPGGVRLCPRPGHRHGALPSPLPSARDCSCLIELVGAIEWLIGVGDSGRGGDCDA